MFSCYAFKVAPLYLTACLGGEKGVLASVLTIDMKSNEDLRTQVLTKLLDQVLCNSAVIQLLPRGLRTMCHVIAMKCLTMPHKFSNEQKVTLIAYLILIHVILPALHDPEQFISISTLVPNPLSSGKRRFNIHIIGTELKNLLRAQRKRDYNENTAASPTTASVAPSTSPVPLIPIQSAVFNNRGTSSTELTNSTSHMSISDIPVAPSTNTESTNGISNHSFTNFAMDALLDLYATHLQGWADVIVKDPHKQKGAVAWPEAFHAQLPLPLRFVDMNPTDLLRLHLFVTRFADRIANNAVSITPRQNPAASTTSLTELFTMLRECPVVEAPTATTTKSGTVSLSSLRRSITQMTPRTAANRHHSFPAPSSGTQEIEEIVVNFDVREEGQGGVDEWFTCTARQPDADADHRTAVFVLTVRRMQLWLIHNPHAIVDKISAVVAASDPGKAGYFALVVDWTLTHISLSTIHQLIVAIPIVHSLLAPKPWIKKFQEIFVLGSDEVFQRISLCISQLPSLTQVTVVDACHWKVVRDKATCGPKPLTFPEETQHFIPSSFHVWRFTPEDLHGKRRVIKIAQWSVFEFDGINVHSEVRLHTFERIEQDGRRLMLEFSSDTENRGISWMTSKGRRKTWFLRFLTAELAETFVSSLMCAIVAAGSGLKADSSATPRISASSSRTLFPVTKRITNKKKTHAAGQSRHLLVSPDCLISLSGNSVRTVWPFNSIANFRYSNSNRSISFSFGGKDFELVIEGDDRVQDHIAMGIARMQAASKHLCLRCDSDLNQLSAIDYIKAITALTPTT
eukprot:c12698_g1_i4.p1 GENE.c12698_g1_i4~~c12698_g1_i4.p1  ORF type:complete len:797 (-),score=171.27 c12698_g1_i4:221-2611(-)